MTLSDILRVLRRRWRALVACTLLGLVLAASASLLATPMYRSTATLFISTADTTGGVAGAYTGSLFTQQRVRSYVEFVSSPAVAQSVARDLGLKVSPQTLAAQISAEAPADTTLLNITAVDASPARAREIAQSTAQNFTVLAKDLESGAGGTSPIRLTIVRPAGQPSQPYAPRPRLYLALGGLAGVVLGGLYVFAREALDTRVRSVDVVPEITDSPNLATVPLDPNASRQPLIVHSDPRSSRAEAIRQLRTNIRFIDIDHPPRSILVTSAVPAEGKTTTTCNLAIALAQSGREVLLVEADLRRPRVGEYMGVVGAVGLTDVLVGRVRFDDAVQTWTGTDRLSILPSGALPPNPSELLGSAHMRDLIRELEARYLVIIDAPPLLPVTDAAVLAPAASGALLVVRANSTRKEEVRRAAEALRAVGGRLYGTVYNMAPTRGPDAYGYGYGYGYRDGDGQQDADLKSDSVG